MTAMTASAHDVYEMDMLDKTPSGLMNSQLFSTTPNGTANGCVSSWKPKPYRRIR